MGGIAQLVERLLCKQDVSGSNPLTSTKQNAKIQHGNRYRFSKMLLLDFIESRNEP
jgi:hypothetical protein